MATQTTNNLRMSFRTAGGATFSITIPTPIATLTAAEVETVMDLIVAKNIFVTSSGDITGKQDIKIIDTTINDLYDPPQA